MEIGTKRNLTPQERWWAFKERLPVLSRWQKIALIVGISLTLLIFVVFILPFLLPLGGPEVIPVEKLADENGAFIEIAEKQIYYVHEPGEGDTVILVHGFSEATLTWREVIPELAAAGWNVYALDLPGAGLSEKGDVLDMSHPAQAAVILAFMDTLDIEIAHLVGHAMGAGIITHLALEHPERIQTLTLISADIQTETVTPPPEDLINLFFVKRWARILIRSIMPETLEEQLHSATEKDDVITESLLEDYARTWHTENWDLSMLALVRDSGQNAILRPLTELEMPVLIIWGEEDSWISPERGKWLHGQIPDSQLILLPETGHLPMHESPDELNTILMDFFRSP